MASHLYKVYASPATCEVVTAQNKGQHWTLIKPKA